MEGPIKTPRCRSVCAYALFVCLCGVCVSVCGMWRACCVCCMLCVVLTKIPTPPHTHQRSSISHAPKKPQNHMHPRTQLTVSVWMCSACMNHMNSNSTHFSNNFISNRRKVSYVVCRMLQQQPSGTTSSPASSAAAAS